MVTVWLQAREYSCHVPNNLLAPDVPNKKTMATSFRKNGVVFQLFNGPGAIL